MFYVCWFTLWFQVRSQAFWYGMGVNAALKGRCGYRVLIFNLQCSSTHRAEVHLYRKVCASDIDK